MNIRQIKSPQFQVMKKMVSDMASVELLYFSGEYAVTRSGIVEAVLANAETAEIVFKHYWVKAAYAFPAHSFMVIDLTFGKGLPT